jgi:hypothetical protein
MLDLNVLRSVMEHWFSLKASHSSDHYNITWLNSVLLFPSSSWHRGRAQIETYPSSTSSVIMRVFHLLAIHHPGLLSSHFDTLVLS